MMERLLRRDAPAAEIVPPSGSTAGARMGPRRAAAAAGLCLVAIAYRELLWFAPKRGLGEELEQFFFVPSQTVAPLVVLLAAWLVFRRVRRLRSLPPAAQAPILGGALLAGGAAIHLWGTATGASDLLAPSLALVGLGAAAWWRGRPAVRRLLLPAAFLLFAMPLPAPLLNEVVFRLQIATADFSGVLLSLLRVPHSVAGDQILRPQQTFSVIETCSGLRSIETLTMVAVLMADLFRRSGRHLAVLVLAAPPIALFLNGWRAVALILNPHSEIVAVHNLQGIAILLGGLVLLFLLDGLLERLLRRRPGTPAALPARAEAEARWPAAPLAVLAALSLAALALPRFEVPPPEPMRLSEQLATGIGDLFSREIETDRLFLGSAGFRDSATRRFTRDGHPVDVFVGVGWRAGRARSALAPKTAIPGSGWILERAEPRTPVPGGVAVWSGIYRSATRRLLVYHYVDGAEGLVTETLRALTAIDVSPLGGAREPRVVRLATDLEAPVATGLAPAQARLDAFYQELRPVLEHLKLAVPAPGSAALGGKALPDFLRWEKSFRSAGSGHSAEMVEFQLLESGDSVGMALASTDSGPKTRS